jgi:hypothetical protein
VREVNTFCRQLIVLTLSYSSLAISSLWGGQCEWANYQFSPVVARMSREELEQAIKETKLEI